jgi:hypothetical protein
LVAVLPNVNIVVIGHYNVCLAHGIVHGLDGDAFHVQWTADGIAQLKLPYFLSIFIFADNNAHVGGALNVNEIFDIADGLSLPLHIPKDNSKFHAVLTLEGKDECL